MRAMKWVLCFGALLAMIGCSSASSPTASSPDGSAGGEASSDTWQSWAQGFFATYCVSCHNATTDTTGRDYTKQAKVVLDAPVIRCGVAVTQDPSWKCDPQFPPPKQFPIGNGPKPSDADRARCVAWISAGAP
jgi:hypothetical protein